MQRIQFYLLFSVYCLLSTFSNAQSDSCRSGYVYYITNVKVMDCVNPGPFVSGKAVKIDGNCIVKIVDTADIDPNEAVDEWIDGTGKYLIPGLINAHIHLFHDSLDGNLSSGINSIPYWTEHTLYNVFDQCLSSGVTTLRSIGDPIDCIKAARDAYPDSSTDGPRLRYCGMTITRTGAHPVQMFIPGSYLYYSIPQFSRDTPEVNAAQDIVQEYYDKGATSIKMILQSMSGSMHDSTVKAIIDKAHSLNMRVVAHCQNSQVAISYIAYGLDGTEHVMRDSLPINLATLNDLYISNGAVLVPTLTIFLANELTYGSVRSAFNAGVMIGVGTDKWPDIDGVCPYFGFSWGEIVVEEMRRLATIPEITYQDVIYFATHNNAYHIGELDIIGTIEIGKRADLVLLNSNPLDSIENLNDPYIVFKNGCPVVDNRPGTTGCPPISTYIPPTYKPVHDNGDFSVYPNPNHTGIITISMEDPPEGKISITVYDILGRVLKELIIPNGQTEFVLDLSTYPGINFICIRSDKKTMSRRIIINKMDN